MRMSDNGNHHECVILAVSGWSRHTCASWNLHFWQCPWDLSSVPGERWDRGKIKGNERHGHQQHAGSHSPLALSFVMLLLTLMIFSSSLLIESLSAQLPFASATMQVSMKITGADRVGSIQGYNHK